jgi:hypothetical protein
MKQRTYFKKHTSFQTGGQTYKLREEYHEHCAVIEYLRITHPGILLTIAPNGIKLTLNQGTKFKQMGYTAGTPDILIFEPRGEYHGLFIEMKRDKGGTPSRHQLKWLSRANNRGYKAKICYGFYEAKAVIDRYFKQGLG